MKHKPCRTKKTVLVVVQTSLLLVAVVFPIVQWNANASQQWSNDLQQLEAHRLWLIRALDMLKDHLHVTQPLGVSTEEDAESATKTNIESIELMTLSLIEAIKHQAHTEQIELTQLSVTQSDDWQTEPVANDSNNTGESSVHALTVNFELTTDRAMSLLSHFDALSDAARWRPVEVRGCSVVRLTDSPVSLHASCSVDVYYFPELHR